MQPRSDRRSGRLAGAIRVALAVRVLADGEGLRVSGAVRRVRVRALLRVSLTEVLRLALSAAALGPAALRVAAVLLTAALRAAVRWLSPYCGCEGAFG